MVDIAVSLVWHAECFHTGVLHPFAHLNSGFAASGATSALQPRQQARAEFAAMLQRDVVDVSPMAISGDPAETTIPLDPPVEPTPPIVEPPVTVDDPPLDEPIGAVFAPHIPRHAEVPDSLKWPAGPYREAPAAFGGEWWLTNPFTGEEPWLSQGGLEASTEMPAYAGPEAPEAFLELFGPPPQSAAGTHRLHQSAEMAQWLIDLEHFQGAGVPEGFTQEQVDRAGDLFESWGMGRPMFYEGRYGWKARFPDSGIQGFEAAPFTALEAPHLVVAKYQVKMEQQGQSPLERHPFVPPQIFGGDPLDA